MDQDEHCPQGVREEFSRGVRSLTTEPVGGAPGTPHVVVLPGMGALGYLMPTVQALAGEGLRASLLDLPGFGRRDGLGCRPTVRDVAAAAVSWCSYRPDRAPLVLFGHSTGATSALLAALDLERQGHAPAAVVLAGPVPAPNQRSLPRLLARAPLAYRRESMAELVAVADYRRAGRDALTLLRSAIAERPERSVRALRTPLLVTAGRADAFAPPGWLVALAHAASSRTTRVVRLPGSHNNPFTHPQEMAAAVSALVHDAAMTRVLARR